MVPSVAVRSATSAELGLGQGYGQIGFGWWRASKATRVSAACRQGSLSTVKCIGTTHISANDDAASEGCAQTEPYVRMVWCDRLCKGRRSARQCDRRRFQRRRAGSIREDKSV